MVLTDAGSEPFIIAVLASSVPGHPDDCHTQSASLLGGLQFPFVLQVSAEFKTTA